MTEVVVRKIDVDRLNASALKLLKAVQHAHENAHVASHTIQLHTFCSMAGLPDLSFAQFVVPLRLAGTAGVEIEVVDTEAPDRDDLPFASWPIFKEFWIRGSCFTFEIEHRTFDEEILKMLQKLEISRRPGRR